jgi:enoyl-CoA hydratase/carnithine racemase
MIPGAGGTQLLPRHARTGRAAAMMLLGEAISGERAHEWGLAQALLESAPGAGAPATMHAPMHAPGRAWLNARVAPLLEHAPAEAPLLRLKRLLRAGLDTPLAQALELEALAAGIA